MKSFLVLRLDDSPLGGRCPACDAPMDEFGCRLGKPLVNPGLEGIARVLEVDCQGTAAQRIQECPLCR
jgi:hypothetical protein